VRPPVFEQMFQRALALQQEGQLGKAEGLYRAVLEADPQDHQAANNLGILLLDDRRPEIAIPWLRQAATHATPPEPGRRALAQALAATGDFASAAALFREAAASPSGGDVQLALAYAELGLGRLTTAWPIYDAERPDPAKQYARSFPAPEWQGEPLTGKRLLVWREQGFGDQLMMARYLPLLSEAAEVLYVGRPDLQRLFANLPLRYVPHTGGGDLAVSRFDYWTLPMSLPARLGLSEIPPPPYFTGQARALRGLGVMWRGNPLPHPERTLSEAAGAALLALPGAISLEPEDTGARDFQDTADIIAGLDAVISIDTSVAHLAGAMDKPLYLMLPARFPDWRWMQGRTDNPWYPSARLYRQPRHGDWDSVVASVKADLAAAGLVGRG